MNFISFEQAGRLSYGVWVSENDWRAVPADVAARYPDLKAVIAANALAEVGETILAKGARLVPGAATLLPVLPNPGKVFCVGLNYKSHVAETKRADSAYPAIFTRFADSLLAHGAPLVRPATTTRFDFEGELALVIGKGGREIAQANALDHVAGYACFNDGTARDWQRHTHQWTPGKNFPGTGAFGPVLVPRAELPEVSALTLETRVNGAVMQHASVADLIFPLPELIAYVSGFTPLSPGDVIVTGTPGGVGDRREPPVYLAPGDVVEVEITGLGILRNTVA